MFEQLSVIMVSLVVKLVVSSVTFGPAHLSPGGGEEEEEKEGVDYRKPRVSADEDDDDDECRKPQIS